MKSMKLFILAVFSAICVLFTTTASYRIHSTENQMKVANLQPLRENSEVYLILLELVMSNTLPINSTTMFETLIAPERLVNDTTKNYMSLFTSREFIEKELKESFKERLTCAGCYFAAALLKLLQALDVSQNRIEETVQEICIILKISSSRACRGIIEIYAPVLLVSIQNSSNTLGQVCGFLVAYDCGEKEPDWTVPLSSIPKPAVTPVPLPPTGSPQLQLVVIGDPHVDFSYQKGSYADCDEFICCRSSSPKNPKNPNAIAGEWGSLLDCDVTVKTFESMLDDIKRNYKQIDGVIWLGDSSPHDVWNKTSDLKQHLANQKLLLSRIEEVFGSDVAIFPTLGNHDVYPANSFPPSFIPGAHSLLPFYEAIRDIWLRFLPPETEDSILRGGFYSATAVPGLRIISMNTNYCYFANFWLLINSTDPNGQLSWLVDELQKAENKGEKVLIITHIPPCYQDCLLRWSANYHTIINRYESTVVGQVAGHTHYDHFCLFHDDRDPTRATNVVYINPSVTPYTKLNCGYRVLTLDGLRNNSTFQILDHTNYMLDVAQANALGAANWTKLYGAKDAYNLTSLHAPEWQNLVTTMKTNEGRPMLNKFKMFYSRDSPLWPSCDVKCEADLICSMEEGRSRNKTQCNISIAQTLKN